MQLFRQAIAHTDSHASARALTHTAESSSNPADFDAGAPLLQLAHKASGVAL